MRKKYDSFGRWKGARVTMASVAWHVKQQGGVVASVSDNLRDEAKRIVLCVLCIVCSCVLC